MLQQEKPNKFFFDQEKLKQKKIKQLRTTQNNETTITNNSEILKYCKTFYSTLYTKTQTHPKIQKTLLERLKPKINYEENKKLIKQQLQN